VSRVENREPAQGGLEAETLEDAKVRAPGQFRTRTRAVTADDYEYLASHVEGVERVSCLAPGQQPGAPDDPKPGQVRVVVLPKAEINNSRHPGDTQAAAPRGTRIAPPPLSTEVRDAVLATLNSRRLLGTAEPEIRQARYLRVSVQATLRLPERSPAALAMEVKRRAESELYRYLSPYQGGGPHGTGWPFGRDLYLSEIYSLLLRVPGVEFVEDVQLRTAEGGDSSASPSTVTKLAVPRDGVVYSVQHEVLVR
jgi:predicted phage baseplate assembly protein